MVRGREGPKGVDRRVPVPLHVALGGSVGCPRAIQGAVWLSQSVLSLLLAPCGRADGWLYQLAGGYIDFWSFFSFFPPVLCVRVARERK